MKVLVRPFVYGDQAQVSALITEATMSTVTRCFTTLAQREFPVHISLMLSSVIFVLGDVRLQYCLLTYPLTLSLVFLAVWIAHRVKAWSYHDDIADIDANYNGVSRKGFWVAVLLEGNQNDAQTEFIVDDEHYAKAGREGRIVGTVAIDLKNDPDKREPPDSVAWLRRMSVERRHQKRGIGSRLLKVALQHCLDQKFRAVELVTTEFHVVAKQLYASRGFSISNSFHKDFLLGLVPITMYRLRRACTRSSYLEEA